MSKMKSFKEFVLQKENNDVWTGAGTHPLSYGDGGSLKFLEKKIYSLINRYRDSLVKTSMDAGEKDNDIHHDIIKKDKNHMETLDSIAQLFSSVYDLEKDSSKLKPSFFSDTVFEKVARYAKRKLGYHADDIGEHLKKMNPISAGSLYHIWTPGSWARA